MPIQIITDSKENIATKAAQTIEETIKNSGKDKIILGISGGSSVQGIFAEFKTARIPWEKVQIYMADERCAPVNSKDSNYKVAYGLFIKELIQKWKLPEKNIHPFDCAKGDKHCPPRQLLAGRSYFNLSALNAYQESFARDGGKFDIAIFGAGEDGHIASLFPRHAGLSRSSEGFIKVEGAPKPPPERISASLNLIARTDTSIILFLGESKQEAFYKFMDENISLLDCPAKIVKQNSNAYVFVSKLS